MSARNGSAASRMQPLRVVVGLSSDGLWLGPWTGVLL